MNESTLSRLEEFRNTKKFYDALQFYRTKITRSFRSKNPNETAIPLVKHGLEFFLSERQYQCAIDLINVYVESLSKNKTPVSKEAFDLVSEVVKQMFRFADKEEENNSEKEKLLDGASCKFVDLAIQWTKQDPPTESEKKYGSLELHRILANTFLSTGQMDRARVHLFLSDNANGVVQFVQDMHTSGSDRILDYVETILQILCLDRFPFAVDVFGRLVSPQKYPFDTPLLNFIHILFGVIETENTGQFAELTSTYQSELKRSLASIGYLGTIGQLYFGISNGQSDVGLGSILSGLFGKQNESNRAVSHISSRTPRGQRAPEMPGFAFPQFPGICSPNFSASTPKGPIQADDDLD